jgi:hypothetical protein
VPVTEEQIAALQDRMESNGTDKVKFFEMLGVSKLSDIKTQKQYAQAIAAQDKKDALLKAKTEAA